MSTHVYRILYKVKEFLFTDYKYLHLSLVEELNECYCKCTGPQTVCEKASVFSVVESESESDILKTNFC